MSIVGQMVRGAQNLTTPTWHLSDAGLATLFEGRPTSSGVAVTQSNALTVAPYFDAIRIISEDIAGFPFPIYRRLANGRKELARDSHFWRLVNQKPNPWQSSRKFRECMTGMALLRGDALALPTVPSVGTLKGLVVELLPLMPDAWRVEQQSDFSVLYYVRNDQGGETPYTWDEVFHLSGFGLNGLTGLNLLTLAREDIGEAIADREYSTTLSANGARPGGYIQAPANLTKSQAQQIQEEWNDVHRGISNSHRVAVLPFGMSWQDVGMTPESAKIVEQRAATIVTAAAWFRMPPHKLGDLSRATWGNVEEENIDYVRGTLLPWMGRWEDAIDLQVLKDDTLYSKMNAEALLRGNTETRYQAYARALGSNNGPGWETVNEIRDLEDKAPIPGGDALWEPKAGMGSGAGGA